MKEIAQVTYAGFISCILLVAGGCSQKPDKAVPPTADWHGEFYWTTGAEGEPVRKLQPWQQTADGCPPGFCRFRRLAPSATSSAQLAGEAARILAVNEIRNPEATCAAFASFESDPQGGFVPSGWCFWFSNGRQEAFVRISAGAAPEVNHWEAPANKRFRPLPSAWLDSSEVLEKAEAHGWGLINNLTAPGVGSMRLQMTDPGPVNAPSAPMWQTPFVALQRVGDTNVPANIFVHGVSGEVFVSRPIFPPAARGRELDTAADPRAAEIAQLVSAFQRETNAVAQLSSEWSALQKKQDEERRKVRVQLAAGESAASQTVRTAEFLAKEARTTGSSDRTSLDARRREAQEIEQRIADFDRRFRNMTRPKGAAESSNTADRSGPTVRKDAVAQVAGEQVVGEYSYSDGRTYVGQLANGIPHGKGTLLFPDGRKYVGAFSSGVMHGKGTLTYRDGKEYVGEFMKGEQRGQGTLTARDGTQYVGEFRNGKGNGKGTMTYADGTKRTGEFLDGQQCGKGTMEFADGMRYVGEFQNGQPHGKGTLTSPDGQTFTGEFRYGKAVQ